MGNNSVADLFMKPLKDAAHAARVNLVPGLILQFFALSLVLAYYFYLPSRPAFDYVANLKLKYGYIYSLFSTALFGALLPFIFLGLQKKTRAHAVVRHLPFLLIFWAAKGVEVDVLYRLQSWFFGTDVNLRTVLPKILVDQFVYMTLWGGLTMVLGLYWKDVDYSFAKTRAVLNRRFYPDFIFPVVVSNWAVWLPAVAIVYCLPLPLQLPIENIILCFWVLMLTLLTNPQEKL